MKINSVGVNQTPFYSDKNKKQKQTSFKASPFLQTKVKSLLVEAKNLARTGVKLDRNLVESFVRCFGKDIQIIVRDDLFKGSSGKYAYLEQEIMSNPSTGNPQIKSSKLNLPSVMFSEDSTYNRKIFNISTIIHELTHFFDQSLDNPESIHRLYFDYLTNRQLENINVRFLTERFFHMIQHDIQTKLCDFLRYNDSYPQKVPYDNGLVDNIFVAKTSMSLGDYVLDNLAGLIESFKADKHYAYKMLSRMSEVEYDAYSNQTKFLKDILNITGFTDVEYRDELYKKMKRTFDAKI